MTFLSLELLLGHKNPRFLCVAAGGVGSTTFESKIVHEISPGLSSESIEILRTRYGDCDQLFEFLVLYGSLRLYCDKLSNASAFYLSHPSEWDELRNEFSVWIDQLRDNEGELVPDWLENALVFGEEPGSANYFFYIFEGVEQGKVFEFESDGFSFVEVGDTFCSFIEFISSPTDSLLSYISAHTRHRDGETEVQWVPLHYLHDD